jgi:hypothetical protein
LFVCLYSSCIVFFVCLFVFVLCIR